MLHDLAKCTGKSLKDVRTAPEERPSTSHRISCFPDQQPLLLPLT